MDDNKFKERLQLWTRGPLLPVLILVFAVVAVVAAIFVIFGKDHELIDTSNSIGEALIVAIPTIALFLAASIQLERNRESQRVQLQKNGESQRAAFLGEYVSKIFTDRELSDTFHYLIYTYGEDMFCRVRLQLTDNGITEGSGQKEMYQCLETLQDGRKEGFRFYHPDIFQGSVEEKRLDSLLGYFSIIAYYCVKEKLLSIDDINGSIGYHLTVIGARTVVREYMIIIEEHWEKEGYAKEFGMQPPFHYLKILLERLAQEREISQ